MIEAYQVGVSLVINSNAVTALGEMADQFATIDRLAKSAQASASSMAASLRTARDVGNSAASAWQKAAEAMERAAGAARGMAGGMPGPGGASNAIGPRSPSGLIAFQGATGFTMPPGAGQGPAGLLGYSGMPINYQASGSLTGAGAVMLAGLSPAAKMYLAYRVGRQAFRADMNAGGIEAGLMGQGFDQSQVGEAYGAAVNTQQNVLGSSVIGNLNLISKLMAVVQDAKASVALLPEFARLGVVLDAVGKGGEGDAMMSAIRAGEFRGVLSGHDEATGEEKIDPARLLKFIRMMQAATVATKGQIGPAQIYQFLKSGGVTASMIDDESLFADSLAMQMAMGSSRAGTALQALGQQFGAGRMSSGSFELMKRMGMIADPSKAEKLGIGQFMLYPGAIDPKIADAATNRPTDFVMKYLLPHMREFMAKEFGDTFKKAGPEEQQKMIFRLSSSLASRQTGANEIVEIIRNSLLIDRDRAAITGALGRDAYDIQAQNNPQLRVKALGAAWEAFEIAAMKIGEGPMIAGLNATTTFLDRLGTVARIIGPVIAGPQNPLGNTSLGEMVTGPNAPWRFNVFDRRFWITDPAAPPIELRGNVVMDGRVVGNVIARQLDHPDAGPAGPDTRATPYPARSGATP